MRQDAAGVGHHRLDLAKEHDPGWIGHDADQDVAAHDLVKVLGAGGYTRDTLGNASRCWQPFDHPLDRVFASLLAFPALRPAPQSVVGLLVHRPVGYGADPTSRANAMRLVVGLAGFFDDGLPVIAVRVGHVGAQLVVLQEHDVLGVLQQPSLDHAATDRQQDQAHPAKGPLVHVKVVVGGEGHHPGGQLDGGIQFCPLFGRGGFGYQRPEFLDGGIVVIHHLLVLGWKVIVGGQVALDALDGRGWILDPQLVDVLVGVH